MAGRAAGGTLTRDDLAEVRPVVVRCEERKLRPPRILQAPWEQPEDLDGSHTHVVVAADGRGLVAAACYEVHEEGPGGAAFGPRRAAAGFARPAWANASPPGHPLPAAATVALQVHDGVVGVAFGVAQAKSASRALDAILRGLDDQPTLSDALAQAPEGRAVGLVVARDLATAFG